MKYNVLRIIINNIKNDVYIHLKTPFFYPWRLLEGRKLFTYSLISLTDKHVFDNLASIFICRLFFNFVVIIEHERKTRVSWDFYLSLKKCANYPVNPVISKEHSTGGSYPKNANIRYILLFTQKYVIIYIVIVIYIRNFLSSKKIMIHVNFTWKYIVYRFWTFCHLTN